MNLWHHLVLRVRGWVARIRSAVSHVASSVQAATSSIRVAVGEATQRHRERADEDTAYARTISTAVSELVATMVPRPSLATTVAVALAGILGHPQQHADAYGQRSRDPYLSHGTGSAAVPPAVPGSLWDRFQ